MKEAIYFVIAVFVFLSLVFLIQHSGKEIERKSWCDKYSNRIEFNECMKEGAEYAR